MPAYVMTANEERNFGMPAQCEAGYRTLAYDGTLGGGMLQILTQVAGGAKVPVSDGKLTAAMLDGNGDMIRQVTFRSSGNIWVHLTGATAPNATVSIL